MENLDPHLPPNQEWKMVCFSLKRLPRLFKGGGGGGGFQAAKKVLSDSIGLVDFAIRQVNSLLQLPDW